MTRRGLIGALSVLLFAATVSGDAPWRPQRRSTYRPQPENHFLDPDEAQRDRRSRPWIIRPHRRPGDISWTTRLQWTNVGCFVLQTVFPQFTRWGIKRSDKILAGKELYRLVSPMVLHGGIGHLATNAITLSRIGPDVERFLGPGRFLATYLASGIAGNLLSAFKTPNPGLGASGAIAGLVGAHYVFVNRNEWLLGQSYADAISSGILQTVMLNVLIGLRNPVIDNWAHLGGLLGGAGMVFYFGPRLYVSESAFYGRLLIDRPIVRLPRSIESIPENLSNGFQRITRRMQVERFKADMPERPWRQNRAMPGNVPNKSVRPKRVPNPGPSSP